MARTKKKEAETRTPPRKKEQEQVDDALVDVTEDVAADTAQSEQTEAVAVDAEQQEHDDQDDNAGGGWIEQP